MRFGTVGLKDVAFSVMAREVDSQTYKRGLTYRLEGRVIDTRLDGDRLVARVRGSDRHIYRVDVGMRAFRATPPAFIAECSCPVGYNCKHAVAAVVDYFLSKEGMAAEESAAAEAARKAEAELPFAAKKWIDELLKLEDPEAYPDTVNQRVVYILTSHAPAMSASNTPELRVNIRSVRINKSGEYSKRLDRPGFDRAAHWNRPGYILESDVRLYEELNQATHSYSYSYTTNLLKVASLSMLERLVATERLYWEELGPTLAMGNPREGRIEWQLSPSDRMLHPKLLVDGGLGFNALPLVYVDPENALVGRVDLPLNTSQARAFLNAPALKPEHAALMNKALQDVLPQAAATLLPKPPLPPVETEGPPIGILHLTTTSIRSREAWGRSYRSDSIPVLEISFRYGEIVRTWRSLQADRARTIEVVKGERLFRAMRDLDAENDLVNRIELSGAELAGIVYPGLSQTFDAHYAFDTAADWLYFLDHDLPQLKASGFEIRIDDNFPYQLATASGDFDFNIQESSGTDWLELHTGIEVDGERVDLAPMIADLIKNPAIRLEDLKTLAEGNESLYFQNRSGRYFAVAIERLLPLIISLHELRLGAFAVTDDGALRLHKASQALVDFTGDFVSSSLSLSAVKMAYRALSTPEKLTPVSLPDSFQANLRPYQQTGVAWLDALRQTGLGGILADDMGLGKTIQVLAFLSREKAEGRMDHPSLVVMPTSLVANWVGEAAKFAPELRITVLHGKSRQELLDEVASSDVVITTYPLIVRDYEWLQSRQWYALILDEAQAIKNPNAATTRRVRSLTATHRLCLSGTPMENHLGELWSLMNFVNPGFLGDHTTFTREFRTPIEKARNEEVRRLLVRRVRPFLLRRTKVDVAKELPPKSEIMERITLQGKQRDLYDTVRLSLHKQVRKAIAERGLAKSHIIVLDALLKLRQVCCDPSLLKIDGTEDAPSAKLERLMEMVEALSQEGRRIIIFSQFTSMLDLISKRLDGLGVAYGILTGKSQNRKALVDGFQSGEVPVFLVSLKAGGTGLNLTTADTVILYDPWWNPAVEAQAIDRAYRIGQDKPVFVYRLCAEGTIEDKMDEMKARKQGLADSLFSEDEATINMLSDADIESLFS